MLVMKSAMLLDTVSVSVQTVDHQGYIEIPN